MDAQHRLPAGSARAGSDFPDGFVWGAATSSYQIEGAVAADGRVDSIWDTFCREPGAILDASSGAVACDHYRRWPQDLDLIRDLGLGGYRFSVAWPRVFSGPGRLNRRGLDFYSRLVDGMLERGIEPWITLYHWDLPQWLEDLGGWPWRGVVDHFTEYALAVHARLGDRVRRWATLNEPFVSAFPGYAGGQHAPGTVDPQRGVSAAHHLLLAHGTAARAIQARDPDAEVGIVLSLTVVDPADPDRPEDVRAARRLGAVFDDAFLGSLFDARYPQEVLDAYASRGASPPVIGDDLATIATPLSFLGVNYYHGHVVTDRVPDTEVVAETEAGKALVPMGAEGTGPTERITAHPCLGAEHVVGVPQGRPTTVMGWEVQPDGLSRLLVRLHREYTGPAGVVLYVTENGAPDDDVVAPDGAVVDEFRAGYIEDHLRAVHRALAEGADVRGYFVWSLLDNFEWAQGYTVRMGIVHVDFDTQVRTPKLSARRYSAIARSGILPADPGGQDSRLSSA